MKQLFCIIGICLLPFLVKAQDEFLIPLSTNSAYEEVNQERWANAQRSGNSFDVNIESIEPNCGEADGSIVVTIQNGTGPFYQVNVGDQSLPPGFSTEVSFGDLSAGGYLVTVTDLGTGEVFEQLMTLDDKNNDLSSANFSTIPAKCNGNGIVRYNGTIDVSISFFTIYSADNSENWEIDNINKFRSLPVGWYYVEKVTADGCKSFWPFEIKQEIIAPIPFFEDFNDTEVLPNNQLWEDEFAYVNTTFPINPPSIGVATLDGLNEYGQPYNPVSFAYGDADVLTSRPFCMTPYYVPDDSLHLSFFYQAAGCGDFPNLTDSLFVEFLDADTIWNEVFAVPGTEEYRDFEQVIIPIIDLKYFHNNFRFRFRNKATISGNNDHWHIDYVRVEPLSVDGFSIIDQVYYQSDMSNMLVNYQEMPWKHFYKYQDTELNNNIGFWIRTYSDSGNEIASRMDLYHYLTYGEVCVGIEEVNIDNPPFFDIGEPEYVDALSSAGGSSNAPITIDTLVNYINEDSTLVNYTSGCENDKIEEVSIETVVRLYNDDYTNELSREQVFSNYFAYDDGSAELAYGLFGANSNLLYQYTLNETDTLKGLAVHFTNIVDPVDNELALVVYKSIANDTIDGVPTVNDTLYFEPDVDVTYGETINGFTVFDFEPEYILNGDSELIVNDTVYVGIVQKYQEEILIGFDCNTKSNEKIFYNTSGIWYNSIYEGSLMLRLMTGCETPWAVSNENVISEATEMSIYPNPTTDVINFETAHESHEYHIQIMDLYGRLVKDELNNTNQVEIGDIAPGMYIFQLEDADGQLIGSKKIVKQ